MYLQHSGDPSTFQKLLIFVKNSEVIFKDKEGELMEILDPDQKVYYTLADNDYMYPTALVILLILVWNLG